MCVRFLFVCLFVFRLSLYALREGLVELTVGETLGNIFSDLPTSCLWSYNREPETQIIDYKTQQYKLLPGLAMAYASKFAFDHVWRSFQERQKKIAAGDLSILPEVK